MTGVVGVNNAIRLRPVVAPSNITRRIRDALTRQAEREARDIDVAVAGSTVTLRGRVASWAERSAARRIAWSAPGISAVVDDLKFDTDS